MEFFILLLIYTYILNNCVTKVIKYQKCVHNDIKRHSIDNVFKKNNFFFNNCIVVKCIRKRNVQKEKIAFSLSIFFNYDRKISVAVLCKIIFFISSGRTTIKWYSFHVTILLRTYIIFFFKTVLKGSLYLLRSIKIQ